MITQPRRYLSLTLVLALAACSGACSGSTAPSTTTGSGGAGGGGSGNGGASGGNGGNGACPSRPDLVTASPACNTVANSASAVPFTQGTGAPPTAMGGTIRDGLYESTRAEGFGTATPAGRRITIAILDGATQWLWSGEVLDAAGTQVTTSFREDATVSVSGTRVNFTSTCRSGASSLLPAALNFTVSGDAIVLFLDGPNAAATTYTRRGCAP